MGKINEFYDDTTDLFVEKALGRSSWTLPLSHPYHLLTLLCPLRYAATYW